MIDLSYKPKQQPKHWEPEEIIVAGLAIVIWVGIVLGIMAGC